MHYVEKPGGCSSLLQRIVCQDGEVEKAFCRGVQKISVAGEFPAQNLPCGPVNYPKTGRAEELAIGRSSSWSRWGWSEETRAKLDAPSAHSGK